MEHKKPDSSAHVDQSKGGEVQAILEKLVTHLLVKKPEDPVRNTSHSPSINPVNNVDSIHDIVLARIKGKCSTSTYPS